METNMVKSDFYFEGIFLPSLEGKNICLSGTEN